MDTRNDNTTVVNNQTNPVNNPQGMQPQQSRPGMMPPPAMPQNPSGDNQDAKRAMIAAAAIILGGAVGVGGVMAANSISDQFDANEADIDKAIQQTQDAQEQAEEAMKEAQNARDEANAARLQAEQQPKVVHVNHIHEPEDDLKVFYYQHIVDENGNEMDIAYVERNGVKGYYADVDTDGKADYFLPEDATSAEQIINVHDYGEDISMGMMAKNADYVFATYNPEPGFFGGEVIDDGGAAITTGFDDGPAPDNDDVIIANYGGNGPDYVNNANVENMTGTVSNTTYLGTNNSDVAMLDDSPEPLYDDIDNPVNNIPYDEMPDDAPYEDIDQLENIDIAATETYDEPPHDSYIEETLQDPYLADTHIDSGLEDPAIDGTIA